MFVWSYVKLRWRSEFKRLFIAPCYLKWLKAANASAREFLSIDQEVGAKMLKPQQREDFIAQEEVLW